MPTLKCENCSHSFYRKPSYVKAGYGQYCSSKCQYKGARNGKLVKCFICEKEIYKSKAKLKHSKSKKYFCNKSCQTKWRNSIFIGEKHKSWKHGNALRYRNILRKTGCQEICKKCGIQDKRILAVHHIDQNRKNNKSENLVWLCHNCHHEVHYDKVEKYQFI
ncbi:hypothetical protein CL630_03020 [bacterium]|nr:hypothetical protein [bacterium]|tara:strand:- start:31736 stop:32221 length:486 start_codon:yes stop_codon:yes gene_type:complete